MKVQLLEKEKAVKKFRHSVKQGNLSLANSDGGTTKEFNISAPSHTSQTCYCSTTITTNTYET